MYGFVIEICRSSLNLVQARWYFDRVIPLELRKKNWNFQFLHCNLRDMYKFEIAYRVFYQTRSNLVLVQWLLKMAPMNVEKKIIFAKKCKTKYNIWNFGRIQRNLWHYDLSSSISLPLLNLNSGHLNIKQIVSLI